MAVVSGTATAVSNRVSRRQGNRWAQQEPQQAPAYQRGSARSGAGASRGRPGRAARKLGELRDKGVLTEAEFEAQKAKLLG